MTKRILCIDGGGILGVGPAKFLKNLEEHSGKTCFELFDGFAGTSTGSILAALLACGYPAKQALDIYHKSASQIFYRPWYRKFNPMIAKYDGEGLKKVLDEFFKYAKMNQLAKPLYIPASDIRHNQKKVWDRGDKDVDISYAVRTSCSAPTYFPPVDGQYADGGMWANCPTMVGLVGYSREMNVPLEDIWVMSLGTGGVQPTDKPLPKDPGPIEWLKRLIPFFMVGTEESANFYAQNLPIGQYIRFEPIDNRNLQMDDLSVMGEWEKTWDIWWNQNMTLCESFFSETGLLFKNHKPLGVKTNVV